MDKLSYWRRINMTNTIRISFITFFVVLMATTVVHAVNLSEMNGASLILTNGRICTESATEEAMAIGERGIILAVGDVETVNRYKRSTTQVIDLVGDTVLPGLHDTHVHPSSGYKRGCNFEQGSSLKKVQETIAECVREKAEKEWITCVNRDAVNLLTC